MRTKYITAISAVAFALLAPMTAYAYGGPGSGLSVIGTVLTFLAAMFFALVGFVWYPVKRVIRAFRSRLNIGQDSAAE